MAVGQDTKGAFLSYVTRKINGTILTTQTRFNEKTRKQEEEEIEVKNPVIVFFPNRTSQVMSAAVAERLGFLHTPTIVNMNTVDDQESPAGRVKFGINDATRYAGWMELEGHIISRCLAKGGYPIPRDAEYDEESLFYQKPVSAAQQLEDAE